MRLSPAPPRCRADINAELERPFRQSFSRGRSPGRRESRPAAAMIRSGRETSIDWPNPLRLPIAVGIAGAHTDQSRSQVPISPASRRSRQPRDARFCHETRPEFHSGVQVRGCASLASRLRKAASRAAVPPEWQQNIDPIEPLPAPPARQRVDIGRDAGPLAAILGLQRIRRGRDPIAIRKDGEANTREDCRKSLSSRSRRRRRYPDLMKSFAP